MPTLHLRGIATVDADHVVASRRFEHRAKLPVLERPHLPLEFLTEVLGEVPPGSPPKITADVFRLGIRRFALREQLEGVPRLELTEQRLGLCHCGLLCSVRWLGCDNDLTERHRR